MKIVIGFFAFLAGIGSVLSLTIHLGILTGMVDSLQNWILLVPGIFVVWLPAVLAAQFLAKGYSRQDLWPAILRGCPDFIIRVVRNLNGYANIKFWLVFVIVLIAFTFPIQVPGDIVGRMLGAAVTGVWMVFYVLSFAILCSAMLADKSGPIGRCTSGHTMFSSQFCPWCGEEMAGTNLTPPDHKNP